MDRHCPGRVIIWCHVRAIHGGKRFQADQHVDLAMSPPHDDYFGDILNPKMR
jgi:hypothetical protein